MAGRPSRLGRQRLAGEGRISKAVEGGYYHGRSRVITSAEIQAQLYRNDWFGDWLMPGCKKEQRLLSDVTWSRAQWPEEVSQGPAERESECQQRMAMASAPSIVCFN